jgi:hypothetical protein
VRIWIKFLIAGLVLASFSIAFSLSTGPEDARTGAPGEQTCQVGCHNSFTVNSGNGELAITAPASYAPGETLDLAVHIEDPGQMRWGFELTVLDSENQPVGALVVTDLTRTQLSLSDPSGRDYLKHTLMGTNQVDATAEADWNFSWTAPAETAGPVTFYAAGNAANGNGTNQGDFIYTTMTIVEPELVASCCDLRVGDANSLRGDEPTIGDVSVIIDAKFITGVCDGIVACLPEADIDQSGGIDPTCDDLTMGDIMILIDYLFITGTSAGLADCM